MQHEIANADFYEHVITLYSDFSFIEIEIMKKEKCHILKFCGVNITVDNVQCEHTAFRSTTCI
jgi:hypothetical protein